MRFLKVVSLTSCSPEPGVTPRHLQSAAPNSFRHLQTLQKALLSGEETGVDVNLRCATRGC